MLKLEIVSNSLQVSQGSSIILVIPKDTLAIDTLQLSLDIPKAYIYNKYQGVTTPVLQEILSDCQDSSGTTFTPSSFIAFAETNFGSSGGGGGTTFDGQLTQGGSDVSDSNPLPVKGGVSDTTFQDSTGQLFIYRDNGIDTPIAYKIPDWTVYTPIAPITATSSPLTNYALENGGNLASIDSKTPALQGGKVPVTDPTSLPLPTGASTSALQTTGNNSLASIDTVQGTKSDSAYTGTGDATEISALKGVYNLLNRNTYNASNYLNVNFAGSSFTYSSNNSTNGNSTAFSLTTGNTWSGTLENAINQPYAIISVSSTQNVTLTIQQFLDSGATIKSVPDKTFIVTANVPYSLPVAVLGNYFRLQVSNTSGSTSSLIVDTYYGGLPVQPDSLTQSGNFRVAIQEALPTGSNKIGQIVSTTGQPSVTPTVTASSAYTTGNIVGGLMTFTNAFATGATSGVLQSIVIRSKSVQTATFKLYVFSQQPTNTTWTDKTAPSINSLDLPYLIDYFIFAAPDSGLGTMTIYTQDGLGKSLVNTAGTTSLWAVLVVVGTPTFSSTSDISVTLGILQD